MGVLCWLLVGNICEQKWYRGMEINNRGELVSIWGLYIGECITTPSSIPEWINLPVCKINKSLERWRQCMKRSTLVGVLGVRLHHAAEEQKSEVPGSSGILWLKINKAIFIFNITTLLTSSDLMPFSLVYHVDCIILSLVSRCAWCASCFHGR